MFTPDSHEEGGLAVCDMMEIHTLATLADYVEHFDQFCPESGISSIAMICLSVLHRILPIFR